MTYGYAYYPCFLFTYPGTPLSGIKQSKGVNIKMHKKLAKQKGFTLVELAIVLVIIGLILGATLKGQGMIENAKIKNVLHQANEVRAAVYTYQDRYKALPGDDLIATIHTGILTLTNGDGDGLIETVGNEHINLFNHLAAAGLINGSPVSTTLPNHAFGDSIYVLRAVISGRTANWIYYENIPGSIARTIDFMLDDGVFNTGAVRTSIAYTNDNSVILYIEF